MRIMGSADIRRSMARSKNGQKSIRQTPFREKSTPISTQASSTLLAQSNSSSKRPGWGVNPRGDNLSRWERDGSLNKIWLLLLACAGVIFLFSIIGDIRIGRTVIGRTPLFGKVFQKKGEPMAFWITIVVHILTAIFLIYLSMLRYTQSN